MLCSDLQRALDGARLVAGQHGLEPEPDPAFREMSLGELEGVPLSELGARFPEHARRRYQDMWEFAFPGGETLALVQERVQAALDPVLAAHRREAVVLVTHNSVIRVLVGAALSLHRQGVFRLALEFGSITWVEYSDRGPRLGLLNWVPDAPTGGGTAPLAH